MKKLTVKSKKNCKTGFPCGFSCQAIGRTCGKKLSPSAIKIQSWLRQNSERLQATRKSNNEYRQVVSESKDEAFTAYSSYLSKADKKIGKLLRETNLSDAVKTLPQEHEGRVAFEGYIQGKRGILGNSEATTLFDSLIENPSVYNSRSDQFAPQYQKGMQSLEQYVTKSEDMILPDGGYLSKESFVKNSENWTDLLPTKQMRKLEKIGYFD